MISSEDELRTALTDAVGEPPRTIDPADVRRRGRGRRSRQIVGAVAVALTVIAALLTPRLVDHDRTVAPATRLGSVCAAGSALPSEPLPARVVVATVIDCKWSLVHEPKRGVSLRLVERHATTNASAYGRALEMPRIPGGCAGHFPESSRSIPSLVADRAGHLYRATVPYECLRVRPEVKTALAELAWRPVETPPATQMLSESATAGPCANRWLGDPFLPDELVGAPQMNRGVGQQDEGPNFICFSRSPGLSGPAPDELVQAVRLAGAAGPVRSALSATPGVPGPDPAGQRRTHEICRNPTVGAFVLMIDGTTVGYADFGTCMRAVGPDLGPAPTDLVQLVHQAIGTG